MLVAVCGAVSKYLRLLASGVLAFKCWHNHLFFTPSQVAGLVVHHTTTLPCLPLPSWLGRPLLTESPPSVFSGASLEVQRQQRIEQLERTMMTMYQRQVSPH